MVTVLGGGREAEALREGVGVVVVAGIAGFLPWATGDTISTASVLGFFLATGVVLGSIRVDGGFLNAWGCA